MARLDIPQHDLVATKAKHVSSARFSRRGGHRRGFSAGISRLDAAPIEGDDSARPVEDAEPTALLSTIDAAKFRDFLMARRLRFTGVA